MSTKDRKKQNSAEIVEITVRDRRQVHQFSIHNRLIDEWLPIITIRGYVLYSFYVRLANRKDERSYPGYTLMERHLRMGRGTISEYNKLLCWCNLIHIEPGTRVRSNDYYILDVPEATPKNLDEIRQKAEAQLKPNSKFLKTLLKRLDEWKPIQELWGESKDTEHQIVVRRPQGQMLLPLGDDEQGSSPAEQGSSPAEQGVRQENQGSSPGEPGCSAGELEQSEVTIQSNNPKQQSEATVTGSESLNNASQQAVTPAASFLQEIGVTEPTLSQIAGRDEAVARAWWWYIQTQPGLKQKEIEIGFLIKRLQSNEPLPRGYLELAQAWAGLSDEQRWTLLQAKKDHRLYRHWHLPDGFPPLSEDALAALTELVEAEVDFGVSEPTPTQINCPACERLYWPDQFCRDCDRCPTCCTCEPVIEDPALVEAQQIWQTALDTLRWQMERSVINTWLKPLQVIGLENGELSLEVENERMKEQLEKAVNRDGLIDQAISDATDRPLKARFVVAELAQHP